MMGDITSTGCQCEEIVGMEWVIMKVVSAEEGSSAGMGRKAIVRTDEGAEFDCKYTLWYQKWCSVLKMDLCSPLALSLLECPQRRRLLTEVYMIMVYRRNASQFVKSLEKF